MKMRLRNSFSASSSSFFCWCVMFWLSPQRPIMKPLTVFARITVGWPLWLTAAL